MEEIRDKINQLKFERKYLDVKSDFALFAKQKLLIEEIIDTLEEFELIELKNVSMRYNESVYDMYYSKQLDEFAYVYQYNSGDHKGKYKILTTPDFSKEEMDEIRNLSFALNEKQNTQTIANLFVIIGIIVLAISLLGGVGDDDVSSAFLFIGIPVSILFFGVAGIYNKLNKIEENLIRTQFKDKE